MRKEYSFEKSSSVTRIIDKLKTIPEGMYCYEFDGFEKVEKTDEMLTSYALKIKTCPHLQYKKEIDCFVCSIRNKIIKDYSKICNIDID